MSRATTKATTMRGRLAALAKGRGWKLVTNDGYVRLVTTPPFRPVDVWQGDLDDVESFMVTPETEAEESAFALHGLDALIAMRPPDLRGPRDLVACDWHRAMRLAVSACSDADSLVRAVKHLDRGRHGQLIRLGAFEFACLAYRSFLSTEAAASGVYASPASELAVLGPWPPTEESP